VISHCQRSLVLAPSSSAAMTPSWSLLQEVDLHTTHPFYHLGNFFFECYLFIYCLGFLASIPLESLVHYSRAVRPSITWGVLAPVLLECLVYSSHAVCPLSFEEFLLLLYFRETCFLCTPFTGHFFTWAFCSFFCLKHLSCYQGMLRRFLIRILGGSNTTKSTNQL